MHSPHIARLVLKGSVWSNRFDPVLAVAVLTTWVGVIPRLVPGRLSDRGIFVSVAERLLAGDTLYSGVYDNKEPLFYYFIAGQLALGRCAEIAAEALLIAIAAAAAYFMAVKLSGSRWTAVAISFIGVPITLTGVFYDPGYAELPGIALVLASIAASACGRPVLAGSCMGLLVFTKLIFMPVALVGVGCFLLAHRRFCEVRAMALGASITAVLVVGVLAVRGELLPFVETIRMNIAYSQDGNLIGQKKGLASLAEHIRRTGGLASLFGEVVPILLADHAGFDCFRGGPKKSYATRDCGRMHRDFCQLACCALDNRTLGASQANPIYSIDHRHLGSDIAPGYGRQERPTHNARARFPDWLPDGRHACIGEIRHKRRELSPVLRRTR